MKNKFLFVFAFFTFLFFGISNVNADTKVGINYDAHEHFNYFYEMKNNTPFYNLLQNSEEFHNSYSFLNSNYYNDYSLIMYATDYFGSSYSGNIKYVLLTAVDYSYNYGLDFSYNNGSFTITYSSGEHTGKVYGFDEDANLVFTSTQGCNNSGCYYSRPEFLTNNNNGNSYTFSSFVADRKENSMANFSYFLSMIYKSNNRFRINKTDFVVTDILINEQKYLIDDNSNYSQLKIVLRDFFSFGGIDRLDVDNTPIEYFRDNIISTTKNFDLDTFTKYGKTINAPAGFDSVTLKNDYIFIPKDINNIALNRKFYSATTEQVYTDKVKANFNMYDLIDGESLTDDTKLLRMTYKKPYTLYSFNPDTLAKKVDESFVGTDYYVGFTNQNGKYKPSLYYNPNAYYVCEYGFNDNAEPLSSCTFINPKTGQEQTLTQNDMYAILSQNDSTGASIDIFASASEQCKVAQDYSELYEYDENCNIIGVSSSLNGNGNALSYITGFTNTIYSLFAYATTLFTALPMEVQSLFYFLLFGGIAIILYRLIRGS